MHYTIAMHYNNIMIIFSVVCKIFASLKLGYLFEYFSAVYIALRMIKPSIIHGGSDLHSTTSLVVEKREDEEGEKINKIIASLRLSSSFNTWSSFCHSCEHRGYIK